MATALAQLLCNKHQKRPDRASAFCDWAARQKGKVVLDALLATGQRDKREF
jgi:hypothetical protein